MNHAMFALGLVALWREVKKPTVVGLVITFVLLTGTAEAIAEGRS